MIKEISFNNERLALIVFHSMQEKGVKFLTPEESSMQLAYMAHPSGKKIPLHFHNEVERTITLTQEVFFIKKGKVRVNFFSKSQEYLESHVLSSGDILLQVCGGHSFEILEDLEMVEVKQGPYLGNKDKTYFETNFTKQRSTN